MPIKWPFAFCLAALLAFFCAGSAFSGSNYGTTSANFLKIPIAPVPAAMAQAYTAMYGTDSVLYNPAGLGVMNYSSISGAHNQYFFDMLQEYLAANFRFSFGAISASYTSFSSDKFQGYDGKDDPSGKISAQFSAIGLTFSKSWPYFKEDRGKLDVMPLTPFWANMEYVEDFRPKTYRLSLGATIKRITERLDDDSAGTFGIDAGALLIVPGHWQFGAAILNNGKGIEHESEAFPLPTSIRFGIAKDFHTKGDVMIFTFAADGIKFKDSDLFFAFGTEVNIARVFQMRAGYMTQSDVLNNFSIGAGMNLSIFGADGFFKAARLDYAFGDYGDFGAAHRIGFQVIW